MAYADKGAGSNKLVSVLLVVLLHIALGFGLIMGLGYEAVKKAVVDTVAINVEEEVPEEEPPPPEIEPMETPPPPITAPPTPFTPPSPNPLRPPPPVEDPPFTPKPDPVPQPTARQCNGKTVMLLDGQPCPAPDPVFCQDGSPAPGNNKANCTKACPAGSVSARVPESQQCVKAGKSEPLKPKGNPGSWVPQSAYPRGPLRDGISGTVGFTLSVGPDGRPTNCSVTSSSGNGELDAAACSNLMKRAKFSPKMENGQAVASTYSNRVRWEIPK